MLTPNINKYIVVHRSLATSRASSVIQNALQKIDLKQAKFSRDPPVGNSNSKSSLFMANEFQNRTLIDQLIDQSVYQSMSQFSSLLFWTLVQSRQQMAMISIKSIFLSVVHWLKHDDSMFVPTWLHSRDQSWCVCFYDLHSKWDIQQK